MLLHNLYISNDGVYHQEFYVSERLDCQWVCVSQNGSTYDGCDCDRQLSKRNELHLSKWVYFIWKYMYIEYSFILFMSKWRVEYKYKWLRCHDGDERLGSGRKSMQEIHM